MCRRSKNQVEGTTNIFNKIIIGNFPILRKRGSARYRRFSENQIVKIRKETPIDIIKTLNKHNKERILKASRKKRQITYKGKTIRVTDFSTETLKGRRPWSDLFQVLKENNYQHRLMYPV
jgi:hypothetical protein